MTPVVFAINIACAFVCFACLILALARGFPLWAILLDVAGFLANVALAGFNAHRLGLL